MCDTGIQLTVVENGQSARGPQLSGEILETQPERTSAPMTQHRLRWRRVLRRNTLLGTVGSIASIIALALYLPTLDIWHVSADPLFPPPFNTKGVPERDSLDLTNRRSHPYLDCFLDHRNDGNHQQAEQCLQRVIDFEEKAADWKTVAVLQGLLGHVRLLEGRHEAAAPPLRDALEKMPQSSCLMLLLWSALKRQREDLLRQHESPFTADVLETIKALTNEMSSLETQLQKQGIDLSRQVAGVPACGSEPCLDLAIRDLRDALALSAERQAAAVSRYAVLAHVTRERDVTADQRYNFVFDDTAQALDHGVISGGAAATATGCSSAIAGSGTMAAAGNVVSSRVCLFSVNNASAATGIARLTLREATSASFPGRQSTFDGAYLHATALAPSQRQFMLLDLLALPAGGPRGGSACAAAGEGDYAVGCSVAGGGRATWSSYSRRTGGAGVAVLHIAGHGSAVDSHQPATPPRHRAASLAIGIDTYRGSVFNRLAFAKRDATRVAAALRHLGFAADLALDRQMSRLSLVRRLEEEVAASRHGDQYVFYYSGHGVTDRSGRHALVLAGDRSTELVALEEIVKLLSYHRGTAIVLIDSCSNRSTLAARDLDAAISARALGPNPPHVMVAGFPGQLAVESPHLRSGLFTEALVRYLSAQRCLEHQVGRPADLHVWRMYWKVRCETALLARSLYQVRQTPQMLRPVSTYNVKMFFAADEGAHQVQ